MKPEYLYEISKEVGLEFDPTTNCLFGVRSGYLLLVKGTDEKNRFVISVSVARNGEAADSDINELVWDEFSSEGLKDLSSVSIDQYLVLVGVTGGRNREKAIEKLQTVIEDLVQFLTVHQFVQVCSHSGEEGSVGLYQIGESLFLINDESFNLLKSQIKIDQEAYASQKENVVMGAVGAFLGSLIGGGVALLLARMNYVALFSGVILGVCSIKGYEILGKKLTKKGIAIASIFMVLVVIAVNQIDIAWELQKRVNGALDFGNSLELTNQLFFSGEMHSSFYLNFGLLAVFTLGGAWMTIYSEMSSRKLQRQSRKIA